MIAYYSLKIHVNKSYALGLNFQPEIKINILQVM